MEKPNLTYIDQLAREDVSVKNTLINVIKEEFPIEIKEYYDSVQNNDFKEIESNVHKVKHKFSILGLEENYENANKYEHNLREKKIDVSQKEKFENILVVITEYLKTV